MDDRQTQIREGAGLEESRLNTEFIDFLKKYSTHALVVIAVIAVGFFGWNKYTEAKENAIASAFSELEAAAEAGKPENLLAVAEDHAGRASIAELGRLYAADLYLNAVRNGLKLGTTFTPEGQLEIQSDILDERTTEEYLTKANEIYDAVVNRTSGKADQVQFHVGGLFGLAAVAESRGKFDDAKAQYERVKTVAGEAIPEFAKRAQARIDSLGQLASLPKLYRQQELPQAKPAAAPLNLIPMESPPAGIEPVGPPSVPAPTLVTPPITITPVPDPAQPPAATPPASTPPATTPPATPPPATPPATTPPVAPPGR